LRSTLAPSYPDLLKSLLKLLPRSISAPALTALLATLLSLFKYLLIPSTHTQLLETTWSFLRQTLPNCLPEVQRATAEVWGATLRRMKAPARERGMVLMAESIEGIEDTAAWVTVFACKVSLLVFVSFIHFLTLCACQSVSQTLHTATVSLFTPLLTYHLACESPDATHTLIRRVLTALIHHVKSADQFAVIGDVLVNQLIPLAQCTTTDDKQIRLRRMLDILSVPCSVRQGSRMPRMSNSHSCHPSLIYVYYRKTTRCTCHRLPFFADDPTYPPVPS